jgi:hypothetical protein
MLCFLPAKGTSGTDAGLPALIGWRGAGDSRNGEQPPACGKRGQLPGVGSSRPAGFRPKGRDLSRHPKRGPSPGHSPLRSWPWWSCIRLISRTPSSVLRVFSSQCLRGLRPGAGVPKARP